MTNTSAQVIAAAQGILNVPAIAAACDLSGLPFNACLALVQMESGGANIYGHDKGGVFTLPAGQTLEVTEENFTEFLTRVQAGETSNGVGPCQITYPGYFPQMIARGLNPWDPTDSCRFGFELMAANYARYGTWTGAGAHYNGGTNPNATALAYGQRFAALVTEWQTRLEAPMPTVDPPSPPFVAARWHGGAQTPAKRIVIHGTVSPCVAGGAASIAHFFATETNKTSAHYVVDPSEVIQCVGDHVVAYHAPPNQDTIGVELCDPVAGSAARWSDANHTAMLARAADLVARLCLAYNVPIQKCSSSQLLAGQHGICGHVDVSNAWHQTTHTDPGADFPWAHFISLVKTAADGITNPAPVNPKPVDPTPTPDPGEDMPLSDADVAKIAAAVAHIAVTNKDADGTQEKDGTLAGMLSRVELHTDQQTAALAEVAAKLDALTATLQAAIDAGKS